MKHCRSAFPFCSSAFVTPVLFDFMSCSGFFSPISFVVDSIAQSHIFRNLSRPCARAAFPPPQHGCQPVTAPGD